MKFRAARFAMMAACIAVAASAHAQTGDWGDLAIISGTLGNNSNRLCLGVPASMRPSDIGCPTYAPFVNPTTGNVGIGIANPIGKLDLLMGTNGRMRMVGSGSVGTGIVFGTSATDSANLVNNGGSNELIAAIISSSNPNRGFNFGFGPLNGGSTGRLTIRDLDDYRVVGVNTYYPSASLHVSGTAIITSWTTIGREARASTALDVYGTISATNLLINGQPIGQGDRITSGTTYVIATQDRSVTITTNGAQRVVIGENGSVGIGTSLPQTKLDISGTLSFSASGGSGWLSKDGFNGTGFDIRLGGTNGGQFRTVNAASIGTNDVFFQLLPQGANYGVLESGGAGLALSTYTSAPILFRPNRAEAMRLAATGYLGIGTMAPSATLTVSGSAIVSGTVQVAGTGAETCTPGKYGTIRYNAAIEAFQMCRP